jgi:L-alanine-DL-glutamate epimerase-like enolase superfamily enzyme
MSGMKLACWDIAGKAAGLPAWKLLGGLYRDTVPEGPGLGVELGEERLAELRQA